MKLKFAWMKCDVTFYKLKTQFSCGFCNVFIILLSLLWCTFGYLEGERGVTNWAGGAICDLGLHSESQCCCSQFLWLVTNLKDISPNYTHVVKCLLWLWRELFKDGGNNPDDVTWIGVWPVQRYDRRTSWRGFVLENHESHLCDIFILKGLHSSINVAGLSSSSAYRRWRCSLGAVWLSFNKTWSKSSRVNNKSTQCQISNIIKVIAFVNKTRDYTGANTPCRLGASLRTLNYEVRTNPGVDMAVRGRASRTWCGSWCGLGGLTSCTTGCITRQGLRHKSQTVCCVCPSEGVCVCVRESKSSFLFITS